MKMTLLKRLCFVLLFTNCTVNYGQLTLVAHLQGDLEEVSGVEMTNDSNGFFMINDGGNHSRLYKLNAKGKISKVLEIDKKNRDWEDLTKDAAGNVYIGDFGNNQNNRKHLEIYKIAKEDLEGNKDIEPEEIDFSFPNQEEFPPKKKDRHFDVESFFHYNGNLYLFTKSRDHKNYGRTDLYRIPATAGKHEAEFISSYTSCDKSECWITSAAISPDGKKVVLLSHTKILQFTDFKGDDFLSGTVTTFDLKHESQKEGVCFKDNSTVFITDEEAHGTGRNLYRFTLD